MKLIKATVYICLFYINPAQAQESINSSGGSIFTLDGSVSYSIGQVVYHNIESTDGSVYEGVQQPFEIHSSGIIHLPSVKQEHFRLYPNPTAACVILDIGDWHPEQATYQLYDLTGRILLYGEVNQTKTSISIQGLPIANYLLAIRENTQTLQTFIIIKNK